jgi:hypothetical protein
MPMPFAARVLQTSVIVDFSLEPYGGPNVVPESTLMDAMSSSSGESCEAPYEYFVYIHKHTPHTPSCMSEGHAGTRTPPPPPPTLWSVLASALLQPHPRIVVHCELPGEHWYHHHLWQLRVRDW